jgi:shikimate dehydrogenase
VTTSARARLAGVVGFPVSHSLSPRLHGYWLEQYGIDGAYVRLPVAPGDFIAYLRTLQLLGFAGVNVTLPHKEAAFAASDEADTAAKRTGAVNMITFAGGKILGRSTDGYGFLESLREAAPGWSPKAKRAVVLGAGGGARAVVAALLDAGAEVTVTNRTAARARVLAQSIGGKAVDWTARASALAGADLLVNTTLLGMKGQERLDLDLATLPKAALVADIVYVPLETELLANAKSRGNVAVDGLGMLLHQARPAFATWFGREPEVTAELRHYVLAPS